LFKSGKAVLKTETPGTDSEKEEAWHEIGGG
jgi:hypothetical protein